MPPGILTITPLRPIKATPSPGLFAVQTNPNSKFKICQIARAFFLNLSCDRPTPANEISRVSVFDLFLKPFPSKINSTGTFFSGERAWWCGVWCGAWGGRALQYFFASSGQARLCFEWAGAVLGWLKFNQLPVQTTARCTGTAF